MTLSDQQTELLPPRPQAHAHEPARLRPGVLVAVVAAVLVVLATTAVVTAEAIFRAETQRAFAAELRSALSIPESQRVDVDIPGPVLLQDLIGRFDSVGFTVYSVPTGPANADVTGTVEGLRRAGDGWTADRASGVVTLSAAQATALFVPAEAHGVTRVGFSGDQMTIDASVPGATASQRLSIAVVPRFENERLSAPISSVSVGGTVLTVADLAAQTGADLASIQPAPVCVAELLPRSLRMRDVRVADQHLRLDYDIDLSTVDTEAGRELGSCP